MRSMGAGAVTAAMLLQRRCLYAPDAKLGWLAAFQHHHIQAAALTAAAPHACSVRTGTFYREAHLATEAPDC